VVTFDADGFVSALLAGAFDGKLQDELKKLSREQIEDVALLVGRRLRGDRRFESGK
jgi:hypothetical protein